eukprot:gnl/TRDRNA2_/TRDRNA2_156786_c0_seq2.p1 gnl/TRDRNA2_/TRDRNA2_156786_c0~~gnl/TRDRNA2_/TRDRNA2_156786_c0_seq2.p1  ORF type:complete len:728 (-),score=157.53 gnl/TRDRNA2_/TRDRNA2_156786_c0_seq2:109-2292(-)
MGESSAMVEHVPSKAADEEGAEVLRNEAAVKSTVEVPPSVVDEPREAEAGTEAETVTGDLPDGTAAKVDDRSGDVHALGEDAPALAPNAAAAAVDAAAATAPPSALDEIVADTPVAVDPEPQSTADEPERVPVPAAPTDAAPLAMPAASAPPTCQPKIAIERHRIKSTDRDEEVTARMLEASEVDDIVEVDDDGQDEDDMSVGAITDDEGAEDEPMTPTIPSRPHEGVPMYSGSSSSEKSSPSSPGFPPRATRGPDRHREAVPFGGTRCASEYPAAAADYFGEGFAHRLRWAHAVNSRRRLRGALATSAHFLEADVSAGPLVQVERIMGPEEASGRTVVRRRSVDPNTTVCTASGDAIIMAHFPTERSSDLSLEAFVNAVIRHNERVAAMQDEAEREMSASAGAGMAPPSSPGPRSAVDEARIAGGGVARRHDGAASASNGPRLVADPSAIAMGQTDEAAAFAKELEKELDAESQAAMRESALASCVGSRRDKPVKIASQLNRKGVKLDFKHFDCVEPAIRYLRDIDAAKRLGGHLWLNADVFAGPGCLLTPFHATEFVRLCAEGLPEAALSLSWGASVLSTTRIYTSDMVDRMVELCMTPIVPGRWTPTPPEKRPSAGGAVSASKRLVNNQAADGEVYFTPAAICQHITFAVAAEYALQSSQYLLKLLERVPGTSLTIFSGVGTMGVAPNTVQELINTYGKTRLFLDLKLSKSWRSCTKGSQCSLQ